MAYLRWMILTVCLVGALLYALPGHTAEQRFKAHMIPVVGTHTWKIAGIADSDTLKIEIITSSDSYPVFFNQFSVRVDGVDTPEKKGRAKCAYEAALAEKATAYVDKLVRDHANTIEIVPTTWDKYGGRIGGIVYINGERLDKILIDAGLAREYRGGTKSSWCTGDK